MKKRILLALAALVGCESSENKSYEEKYDVKEPNWEEITVTGEIEVLDKNMKQQQLGVM